MDSLRLTNELLNHRLKSFGLRKFIKDIGVLSVGHKPTKIKHKCLKSYSTLQLKDIQFVKIHKFILLLFKKASLEDAFKNIHFSENW